MSCAVELSRQWSRVHYPECMPFDARVRAPKHIV